MNKPKLTLKERLAQIAANKANRTKEANPVQEAVTNLPPSAKLTLKERLAAIASPQPPTLPTPPPIPSKLTLNDSQMQAVRLAYEGKSFVLTGAAGTGKTLTVTTIAKLFSGEGYPLDDTGELTRVALPEVEFRNPLGGVNDQTVKPAIAFVAYTNRAVNNMYGNLCKNTPELQSTLGGNFLTIHKLLEVAPEYYYDETTGKDKMRFTPRRDEFNKLPLKLLIIEEASMVDINLWKTLRKALLDDCQIILLGDLNQLQPVFGDSILNYGRVQLQTVELTHVYRQALDSPIIRQAHNLLKHGTMESDTDDFQIVTGKSNAPVGAERLAKGVINTIARLYDAGDYNPYSHIILSPYNKGDAGTLTLNKLVANFLDTARYSNGDTNPVYEIISGFEKAYYAVGDSVYDATSKQQGRITAITLNGAYYGSSPQPESTNLSRFGYMNGHDNLDLDEDLEFSYDSSALDGILEQSAGEAEDRILAASHSIHVTLDDNQELILSNAGEINALDLGYCLTCHKAQGCEWEKVFIIVHSTHSLANREWLYTAITRAKQSAFIFTQAATIAKACKRQRIKGDTAEQKLENFIKSLKDKGANHDVGLPKD